jgi:hypothetical protein
VTAILSTRSSVRFPLRLPITIHLNDSLEFYAETADISAGGVLFRTSKQLGVGDVITFRIVLPAHILGTETDVLVNCTGRVVRCQADEGKNKVGAVIDEYAFERALSAAV